MSKDTCPPDTKQLSNLEAGMRALAKFTPRVPQFMAEAESAVAWLACPSTVKPVTVRAPTLPTSSKPSPARQRKPRRKSTRALIDEATRAGLSVTALRPDGSIETAPNGKADPLTDNCNEWDEWEAKRHDH